MSFKEVIQSVISKKQSFIGWVGMIFTIVLAMMVMYQLPQLNYFFGKGKLEADQYISAYKDIIMIISGILTFILGYFIRGHVDNQVESTPTTAQNLCEKCPYK